MRVLVSIQPATGHLQPLVPLCQTLMARGHDLRVVSARSFTPRIEALGLPAYAAGLDWLRAEAERWFPPLAQIPPQSRYPWVLTELYAGAAARQLLPDLETFAGEWRPDLILRDQMEFASWLFAERHGIPHVSWGYGLGFQERDRALAGPGLAALRSWAGLPPDEALTSLFHHLRFEFAPAAYLIPDARHIPTTRHLRYRPCDRRASDRVPGWVGEVRTRPLVVATLGNNYNRMPGLFETIIAAAAGRDYELVATIGENRQIGEFGPPPSNVRLETYVPLSALLPHADLVLCHAGFNTLMTAALAGVPALLMPIDSDQPAQALRWEALGIGRLLDGIQLPPSVLGDAVQTMLADPGYRTAVARFRADMEALPNLSEAAALLEELGERGIGPSKGFAVA